MPTKTFHLFYFRAEQVSGDVTERLVIAGYGWDRILQYHSKVPSYQLLLVIAGYGWDRILQYHSKVPSCQLLLVIAGYSWDRILSITARYSILPVTTGYCWLWDPSVSQQGTGSYQLLLVIAGYGWDRILQYHSKVPDPTSYYWLLLAMAGTGSFSITARYHPTSC
jgi:hypothetical protein